MVDEGPQKKKFRDEANIEYSQKNRGRKPPKSNSDLHHQKKAFAHADYSELDLAQNLDDLQDTHIDREDVTELVRICSVCNNIKQTNNASAEISTFYF